jgi:hypothetical protein
MPDETRVASREKLALEELPPAKGIALISNMFRGYYKIADKYRPEGRIKGDKLGNNI